MKKRQTTRAKVPPPFSHFEEAVLDAFSFLITDYGFEYVDTHLHMPECQVDYRNATTGVSALYEMGGKPEIILKRLEISADKLIEAERYSFDFLLMERGESTGCSADEYLSEQSIRAVLNCYADAVKKYGRSVLVGDFKVFPKLKLIAEENQRKKELELFGGG